MKPSSRGGTPVGGATPLGPKVTLPRIHDSCKTVVFRVSYTIRVCVWQLPMNFFGITQKNTIFFFLLVETRFALAGFACCMLIFGLCSLASMPKTQGSDTFNDYWQTEPLPRVRLTSPHFKVRRRFVMFGKKYSSDNAGDGPN